jgi:hypothetical protein
VLLAIDAIDCLLKVQECVSNACPNCTKESVGTLYGALGKESGHAYLRWAFSEAAVRFLWANPEGQICLMMMAPRRMEFEVVNTFIPSSLCCDVSVRRENGNDDTRSKRGR